METTISYIVIFGFGILLAALYLFQKDKKRILPISKQAYPQVILTILIKKDKSKIIEIILQLRPRKKNLLLSNFQLEFTNESHDKELINLKTLMNIREDTTELRPSRTAHFSVPFHDFATLVDSRAKTYDRFRFVVVTPANSKFKSHLLGLHTRWGLFKQDSGRYN